jgi:hypothetical protein
LKTRQNFKKPINMTVAEEPKEVIKSGYDENGETLLVVWNVKNIVYKYIIKSYILSYLQ